MPAEKPLWHRLLERPDVTPREPPGPLAPPDQAVAYAQAAFAAELDELARTPPGSRNARLNIATFNLATLVAGGYLPREETVSALFQVGVATGLGDGEVRGTIRSGMEAGEKHPRYIPPPHPRTDIPEVTVIPGLVTGPVSALTVAPVDEAPPSSAVSDLFPIIDWKELWANESTEEWVVEPLIPARRLVALFSPPKIGKSLLMLELAVGISRGTSVLGTKPDRPRRVLYVDFENDPRGDIRTRLQAMGLYPDDLSELYYLSFPRLPYLDTSMGGLQLLAVVAHYQAEVVVIDTISRAVAGEENDNDTWLNFYRHTGLALKAAEVTCIRLDHTGKDPTKGMRGGSAKYGDVDVVWEMQPDANSDTAVRLECVANRLPIAERQLRLERELDPLRHVVSTRRLGDVLRDVELDLVDELDRLEVPGDAGFPTCKAALRDAGVRFKTDRLTAAVKVRRERPGTYVAPQKPLLEEPEDPGTDPVSGVSGVFPND